MNEKLKEIGISILWSFGVIAFTCLGLEVFLFHLIEYNVYRVLDISVLGIIFLLVFLVVQYLLLKQIFSHLLYLWRAIAAYKNREAISAGLLLLLGAVYALMPSQFPFWIFFIVLAALSAFTVFIRRLPTKNPFHQVLYLLLFSAVLNSSLAFWMHEEANEGRHIQYAQTLAEEEDTLAENRIMALIDLKEPIDTLMDKYLFWESRWVKMPYLSSNYTFSLEENIQDSITHYYQPILTFDETQVPIYQVFFKGDYGLSFKLKTGFRRGVYDENLPYKNLKDLKDFQFAVFKNERIALANSHAFDAYLADVELPSIGNNKKMDWAGFDVTVYRHSEDTYVLIGEPLSEAEVWVSNFAFFFSLLIGIAIFLELLNLFLFKTNLADYWQGLPIQLRIQAVLLTLSCLLFFIIALTTFAFLHQNNATISQEWQIYISETLKGEILEEEKQNNWRLENFSVDFLSELEQNKQCDIDIYDTRGDLIVSSFASATNNTVSPPSISKAIIQQIKKNPKAFIINKLPIRNEYYFRTYFGVFGANGFHGVIAINSFESEIGTAHYIPIVMIKLLSVYVFLLLLTWVSGLFLINLLTKPLQLLANRLSNFQLGVENEKLAWKGDDAIGQLILEYNKMVDKVAETTQELMRSEREGAWQVMAQQIAHEINNRLTPLRLNIQFLTRMVKNQKTEESEGMMRITNGLVEKIDGLSKVATQFSLFAKLENPNVHPIDLKETLAQYFAGYQKKEAYQYTWTDKTLAGLAPSIKMDVFHLHEILNNLLSNAENAMSSEREGKIEMRLKIVGKKAIIELEDNGSGITEPIRENIFEPKFSTTSSQTGLGLPICKKIIQFYDGELSFTTTVGEGSCFSISFPLEK